MVTNESPLKYLFRPEEIELLICGSRVRKHHVWCDCWQWCAEGMLRCIFYTTFAESRFPSTGRNHRI